MPESIDEDDSRLVRGIDPDVDLRVSAERAESRRELRVLGVIALGGMVGATARFVIGETWPAPSGGFPWATFAINLSGCLALGALMALIAGREELRPWVRPFWGTGVIGGYTTFSTYAVEANELLLTRHPAVGVAYLGVSVALGVLAALAGRGLMDLTRRSHRPAEAVR